MNLLRQYVGGPKNRYKDDKFNLDLTYITPRLIAMAFPASGFQKLYRNPIQNVRDFLKEHHGKDYMVINLSGRQVDQNILQNVLTFQWQDHQAPPLQMLFDVCNKMSQFLLENHKNVVAVNCNHGKGRTGTIICCFLLYCNMFKDAQITMDFYAKKRFQIDQGFGVTQPCQVQYVHYFDQILKVENNKLRPRIISLSKIIFRGVHKFQFLYIKAKKFNGQNIVSTKKSQTKTVYQKNINQDHVQELILTLIQDVYFCGDCKLYIKAPSTLGPSTNVATYSFNTAFLTGNSHIISLSQLSPYSLRKSDNFSKNFQIQMFFVDMCKCPPNIQYSQKCQNCRQSLIQQEQKWKQIMKIVNKRAKTQQRQRESMLGYHLQKNIKKMQKEIEKEKINIQNNLQHKMYGNKIQSFQIDLTVSQKKKQ